MEEEEEDELNLYQLAREHWPLARGHSVDFCWTSSIPMIQGPPTLTLRVAARCNMTAFFQESIFNSHTRHYLYRNASISSSINSGPKVKSPAGPAQHQKESAYWPLSEKSALVCVLNFNPLCSVQLLRCAVCTIGTSVQPSK